MENENTTPAPRIEELCGHIKDYLRGYGRPDGKRLALLVQYEAWRLAASAEIMVRCTRSRYCSDGLFTFRDIFAGTNQLELGCS
ncbi:hypothetical protein [Limnohabitans sp. MMS-10A-160]|uniref:hypothetical protein n=1 Tax=Limnohabitans sp. MMS-10A-160 TaxID=1835766 RepID=UPI0011B22CF4|nr:hypothetical protein [Limnohabitans sp. MMS-10A-160]